MKKQTLKKIIPLLSILLLSACTVGKIQEIQENYDKNLETSEILFEQGGSVYSDNMIQTTVIDDYFVGSTAIELTNKDRLPDYFSERIVLNYLRPVSVNQLLSDITSQTDIPIVFTQDAYAWINQEKVSDSSEDNAFTIDDDTFSVIGGDNQDSPLGVDYVSGDVQENSDNEKSGNSTSVEYFKPDFSGQGLRLTEQTFSFVSSDTLARTLDQITQKLDLYWDWENGKIKIFKVEIKHYAFDGANSSSEFRSSTTTSTTSDEQGASSSHSLDYSNTFNPAYEEVDTTVGQMVSPYGKYHVNTNTGIITVLDTPEVQRNVKNYLDRMNTFVGKRILLKTDIVSLASDQNGDYGVDLNLLYSGSSRYGFSLKPISGTDVVNGLSLNILDGNLTGSEGLFTALSQANSTFSKETKTISTRNGSPIAVQFVDKFSYIKSISKEEDDEGNPTYSTEIADLMQGLSLSAIPKLTSRGKIAVQMAFDHRGVNSIETMDVGEGQVIQLPNISQRTFMQDVVLENGQSFVMAGLETYQSKAGQTAMDGSWENSMGWLLGGSTQGSKSRVMTLVVLTPYLVE